MKILVIGRFYEEGFALFIAEELVRMGHEVLRFDPDPTPNSTGSRTRFYLIRARSIAAQALKRARESLGISLDRARLRRLLEEAGVVDLTLSTHDYLSPADAEMIKETTRAPLVLWYPDPVWSFRRHMFLNAPYDILYFKDPYLVQMIRSKLGKRVYYMPECYSPHSLSPAMVGRPDTRYTADLCTAGNLYAYRVAIFQQIADKNLKIWGLPAPLWLKTGVLQPYIQNHFVAHDEKVKAFRGAKIVLNTLNPSEIWGTNVRTFEAAGAGAFQLVDWRPGLSQLFDIGTEVVVFGSLEDLRDKITHYLNVPEQRMAIAEAGHNRARRDHTYEVRLGQLLNSIEVGSEGFPEPDPPWRMPGS